MKKLTAILCLTFAVLLGSVGTSFALPACYGSPGIGSRPGMSKNSKIHAWSNCEGTFIFANGNKYVGEFRNDNFNRQGTKTYADGKIEEGIWRNDKFQSAQKVTPPVVARKTPPPSPTVTAKITPVPYLGDFQKGYAAYQSGDYATALREWTPLAEQGDAYAPYNLGGMYEFGTGVTQDHIYAHMWISLATSNGHEKGGKQ